MADGGDLAQWGNVLKISTVSFLLLSTTFSLKLPPTLAHLNESFTGKGAKMAVVSDAEQSA